MAFLRGAFESKAASAAGVIARATGGSQVAYSGSYSINGKWDIDSAVKMGYERVGYVFRCVDAIASAQADIPMVVRRGDKVRGELVDYPDVAKVLNRRPNTYEDSWQFRYRLSSILLLSRRGAFIEIIKSASGGVAELHLLPPGQVEPIPDARKFVAGYKVRRADWVEDVLDPDQVIWIRSKPHPTDPYAQMTPLVANGLAVETDFFARLFNRNFVAQDGRPGMLVSIKGRTNGGDMAELKSRFEGGGPISAGRTTVIEGDGIDVADFAANPRDVQWAELISGGKNDILMAFGVPESVLGNASGRTFDNADAEWEGFYLATVQDHCNGISRPMDVLTGNIDDEDFVVYDFTTVDVLQRQEKLRQKAKEDAFLNGTATLDNVLKERGEQELNVPASRVYYLGNGIVVAADPADEAAVVAMTPVGITATAAPGTVPAQPGGLQPRPKPVTQDQLDAGLRQVSDDVSSRALRLVKRIDKTVEHKEDAQVVRITEYEDPHATDRKAIESYIEGALDMWSERQEGVVLDRLTHVKVRRGTRHWDEFGTKALDSGYVVELDKWSKEIRNGLEPRLARAARVEARNAARSLAETGVLDQHNAAGNGDSRGRSHLRRLGMSTSDLGDVTSPVNDMIERAAKNQSERIAKRITEMDQDGASMSDIKREVRSMMSNRSDWKKQLAITATTGVIEGAKAKVYQQVPEQVDKTWRHSHAYETARPAHVNADGQVRKVNSSFLINGVKMDRPGDPSAPAGETVNCRCHVEYSLKAQPNLGPASAEPASATA